MGRLARWVVTLLTLAAVVGVQAPAGAGAVQRQFLVRFRSGAPAGSLLATLGAVEVGSVYASDVRVVRGPARLAEALERSGAVDYAEPDATLRVFLPPPNDPLFSQQYAHALIGSVDGWGTYPGAYGGGGGTAVAVIDTGVDAEHEDLATQVDAANSACFTGLLCVLTGFRDDNGHGTHVTGIAAAATNNGRGVAGVAFNARVMALKACTGTGACAVSAVAGALNWARLHGARVVNMSLGAPVDSRTLRDAVRAAAGAGLLLVAAAGNDGTGALNYPAAYPEVVSVAATDSTDARAAFSNANADVELAAPGVDVLSTFSASLLPIGLLPGAGGYMELSGTSMAAPHVAGLAALLFGQHPEWTAAQVRERMADCADDLGTPGRDSAFGFGRINLARALGDC